MVITIAGGGSTFTAGIVKSIALRREELEFYSMCWYFRWWCIGSCPKPQGTGWETECWTADQFQRKTSYSSKISSSRFFTSSRKDSSPRVFTLKNTAWLPPAVIADSRIGLSPFWNMVSVRLRRLPPIMLYRSNTRTLHRASPSLKSLPASKSADQLLSGIYCSSFRSNLSKFLFRMVFSKIAIMVPPFWQLKIGPLFLIRAEPQENCGEIAWREEFCLIWL